MSDGEWIDGAYFYPNKAAIEAFWEEFKNKTIKDLLTAEYENKLEVPNE